MEIVVRDLCKSYGGRLVLDHVTFTAGPGVTWLRDPSGTGKTTLLRILLGLEQADSGTVSGLEGKHLAAVFQEDRLLEHLDAQGNLRFVLGPAYDEASALSLLAELGLAGAEGTALRAYSGGMKRRLALARALLAPSDALVLDEPFAGLDSENRCRCLEAIRRRTAGKPVLLVTHDGGEDPEPRDGSVTLLACT